MKVHGHHHHHQVKKKKSKKRRSTPPPQIITVTNPEVTNRTCWADLSPDVRAHLNSMLRNRSNIISGAGVSPEESTRRARIFDGLNSYVNNGQIDPTTANSLIMARSLDVYKTILGQLASVTPPATTPAISRDQYNSLLTLYGPETPTTVTDDTVTTPPAWLARITPALNDLVRDGRLNSTDREALLLNNPSETEFRNRLKRLRDARTSITPNEYNALELVVVGASPVTDASPRDKFLRMLNAYGTNSFLSTDEVNGLAAVNNRDDLNAALTALRTASRLSSREVSELSAAYAAPASTGTTVSPVEWPTDVLNTLTTWVGTGLITPDQRTALLAGSRTDFINNLKTIRDTRRSITPNDFSKMMRFLDGIPLPVETARDKFVRMLTAYNLPGFLNDAVRGNLMAAATRAVLESRLNDYVRVGVLSPREADELKNNYSPPSTLSSVARASIASVTELRAL